jgi:hypothetical protein
MFLINIKLLTFFKHFRKYIFNNVLTDLRFMNFLFHVPFFCTAAGAVAEIQTVCFVNIECRECKKLILNQVKRASHIVKIIK